ncbi:tRNA (adenosine(37)-N6)-dimethylallyltransferase MiaA [Flavobacteriales bacterium 34_180_T64]|nr:tRNA (adenosine(37)-N6)-dimethylallyltransferase MiaA [Flavobacteriales bacterium 34_180_T64]
MNKFLISIVGPTAIGKTALSIKLAQHFNTEIISADSRQFYKEMSIGTAVPSQAEQASAKHHFIHHKSITEDYNVGAFEKEAMTILNQLYESHDIVIMVGGSGLYVDAVTKGLDDFPKVDTSIRTALNNQLQSEGISSLQDRLKLLDPLTYNSIAIDNPQRVIRALEISIGSSKPYSSFLNKKDTKRAFKTITIGLKAEREIIYSRINKRVDNMIGEGLINEAQNLLTHQKLNALNTVGYKELFNYFNQVWALDFAISEIKKNTRRFAKRQLTWFKKDPSIIWFDYEDELSNILETLQKRIKL